MPLLQPTGFPDLLKPISGLTEFTELRQLMPNLQELAANHSAYTPGLPILERDLLSRSVHPSMLVHRINHQYSANQMVQTPIQDAKAGMFMIHEYDTPQAYLCIESLDRHLSDESILEILTTTGGMYWRYFISPDQSLHGYFGFEMRSNASFSNKTATEHPYTEISIIWPRHTRVHLLKRLRMLAREGCERLQFWPALVGAIAAADQAFSEGQVQVNSTKITGVPAFFARLNAKPVPLPREEPNIKMIEAFALYLAAPWTHGVPASLPNEFDVCGKAFLWQELGKALWSPDCVRNSGKMNPIWGITTQTIDLFAQVADHWLDLVSFGEIELTISGVKLKYDLTNLGVVTGLWGQSVELEYSKIPLEALRYLQPRQTFSPATIPYSIVTGYDAAYGCALAQKLITEAQQRSVFVPSGGFRTAMPPGTPILGVDELCLWSDGKGLWVLPLPGGLMFYWQPEPGNPFFQYTAENDFLSAWNLILAALWHDLITEGSTIFIRTGDEQAVPTVNGIGRKKHRRPGRSQSSPHVLHLPSQRVIYLDGVHAWGTPEEIEKIKRQAHQVRGHRRKLLPGHRRSSYALKNASRFNFIIPDGYTFVKPHQTGLTYSANTPTTETPILARGLASLMLMSKDYQPRSAA
jgi:hypothetical protein